MEAQYEKFLNMIRAIRINVPLINVLAGMPNYGKFLMELISNKHKIEQISAAFLSHKSLAMIQNKVPPKLGDPESFLISCNFNKAFSCNALADLGASINLMSIDVIDEILEEDSDALLDEGSKILHSIEGTLLEEEIFAEFDEFMAMTADENSDSESDIEEPPFEKITINTDYKIKTSLEEPPTDLELKPLPDHLEYVFLEEPFFFWLSYHLSYPRKRKINLCSPSPKLGKMSLYGQKGIVLGHKVSIVGLEVDKAKIDVISKLSPPTNIKVLQEFDIEIKDRKGTENVAADHLSRVENDETSDNSKVDDNFPGETLMEINTKDEPWFADFANYLVENLMTSGAFRKCAIKTTTRYPPYKLIYGKNCHLPFEIEHRLYWVLKSCNPYLIATGEKRMFQLHELDELRHQAFVTASIQGKNQILGQ
ncbi:hypothetical protein Tco_0991595 [Tanacetum coccineum]|uniref:Reverse transcriptase domain-containing protein n=1 Tax=Tanacetum coccineum TaxID=301880 RepID=A0ABQ5EZP2_9ASTR